MATTIKSAPPKTVDEYIAGFPKNVQSLLQEMRAAIHKAAPAAGEAIKYGIPTFVLNGNLVSIAGYRNHVSLYPAPRAVPEFKEALSKFKGPKSTVQFPLDEPLPLALVTKITKFRLKEDAEKAAIKAVAKEKGYGYVLDSSVGVLLVSPAGDDLLPVVKTKLGLK